MNSQPSEALEALDPQIAPTEAEIEMAGRMRLLALESIVDDESFVSVGEAWRVLKARIKVIEEYFEPRKRKAREVHVQMCEDERNMLKPFVEAAQHAADLMSAYTAERERIQRIQSVQQAVEATQQEQSRMLEEAAALEDAGHALNDPEMQFKAFELIEKATTPGSVVVPARPGSSVPAVPGMGMTPNWEGDVTSLSQVVASIVGVEVGAIKHPEHLSLLTIDSKTLRQYASLYKDRLSAVVHGLTATNRPKPRGKRGAK